MFYHLMNSAVPFIIALVFAGFAIIGLRELIAELMVVYKRKIG